MSSKFGIDDFKKDELIIEINDSEENTITINFTGRIYMLNPTEIIGPYLQDLHDKIVDKGFDYINVNFTNLHLLNSSGLKAIIKWFKSIDNLDGDKKYNVKLYYNADVDWQVTSLAMLTELFPKIIDKKPV